MSASITSSKRYLALAVALLALAMGFFAFTASAQAQTLQLAGGYNQLTTDSSTTKALVGARSVPLPILPSWVIQTTSDGQARAALPLLHHRWPSRGSTLGGKIIPTPAGSSSPTSGTASRSRSSGSPSTPNTGQLTAYIPALGARAAHPRPRPGQRAGQRRQGLHGSVPSAGEADPRRRWRAQRQPRNEALHPGSRPRHGLRLRALREPTCRTPPPTEPVGTVPQERRLRAKPPLLAAVRWREVRPSSGETPVRIAYLVMRAFWYEFRPVGWGGTA